MRPTRIRFSVRRLQVTVAVIVVLVAASIGLVQFVITLRYWTPGHGLNTSVFPIGQAVTVHEEVRIDAGILTAGTPGIVMDDPPDEDSAYPYRLVSVRLTDGPHKDTTQAIKRRMLRAR